MFTKYKNKIKTCSSQWKLYFCYTAVKATIISQPAYSRLIEWLALQLLAICTSDTGKITYSCCIHLHVDFAACGELWTQMLATSKPATKKHSSWVSTLLYDYSVRALHALIMEFVIHKQNRSNVPLKCSMVFWEIHLSFANKQINWKKFWSPLLFSLMLSWIQKLGVIYSSMLICSSSDLASSMQGAIHF